MTGHGARCCGLPQGQVVDKRLLFMCYPVILSQIEIPLKEGWSLWPENLAVPVARAFTT